MNNLDDLTIFLNLVDKTRKGVRSAKGNLTSLQKSAVLLKNAFKGIGVALQGALTAGVVRGRQLVLELESMSSQTALTLKESQALFNAVREGDATANLPNVTEALLTLKERFADASEAGAGPLFGLMQDLDNFDIDLGLDNGRAQLANFLEQVSELETANKRIFALKEVLGDEDARAFLKQAQDTEKFNELITNLKANIDTLPDIFTDEEVAQIEQVKESSAQLAREFDKISVDLFLLYQPMLELASKIARGVVDGLGTARDFLKDITGRGVGDPVQLTERTEAFVEARNKLRREEELIRLQEEAKLKREREAASKLARLQSDINQSLSSKPVELQPLEVTSVEENFANNLQAANDARNRESEASQFRIQLLSEELSAIDSFASGLNHLAAAFGNFSRSALENSRTAFKAFKALQIAAATASAYSAAAQALADFKTLGTLEKIGVAATVLGIGLNYAAQISQITASGSGSQGRKSTSTSAVATGSSATPTTAVAAQQERPSAPTGPDINITIVGNGDVSPDQIDRLIEGINENDSGRKINLDRIAA